jgi:hypothetical protein
MIRRKTPWREQIVARFRDWFVWRRTNFDKDSAQQGVAGIKALPE